MDSVLDVVESPAINRPASFLEAQGDFTVLQLIANRAIERFDIPVLARATISDEQRFEIGFFQSTINYSGYELRAGIIAKIVTANVLGRAAYGAQQEL